MIEKILSRKILSLMFCAAVIVFTVQFATAQKLPITMKVQDQLPPGTPTPGGNYIQSIVIDSNAIWMGGGKGLSVSYDDGSTWHNFYNSPAFGTEEAADITIARVPGNKIIVVPTFHIEEVNTGLQTQAVGVGTGLRYRFFYGSDTNWHIVPQPLDTNNKAGSTIEYGNYQYAALPVIVPEDNFIRNVAVTPSGNIYMASFAGGLRKSTDTCKTWQRVLLPTDNLDTITPTHTTAYKGLQLNVDSSFNQRVFSVVAFSDSEIFAGTAGGVNHSTDGGVSWVRISHNNTNGISGSWIFSLARQDVNGLPILWAATIPSDIDTTRDSTNKPDTAIAFSRDDGATWHSLSEFHGRITNNFGFFGTTVYVATDTGLFSSCDEGQSWVFKTLFKDPATREQVLAPTVYAAATRASDSTLFIGTFDGLVTTKEVGCYESNYNVTQVSAALSSPTSTYAYPNPFSPLQGITRIHYRVDNPGVTRTGQVTIEIFDFAMNPVRTLIRNAPRSNDVEQNDVWDGISDSGSHLANGVYFYSVRIDNGDRRWGKILVIQ